MKFSILRVNELNQNIKIRDDVILRQFLLHLAAITIGKRATDDKYDVTQFLVSNIEIG